METLSVRLDSRSADQASRQPEFPGSRHRAFSFPSTSSLKRNSEALILFFIHEAVLFFLCFLFFSFRHAVQLTFGFVVDFFSVFTF